MQSKHRTSGFLGPCFFITSWLFLSSWRTTISGLTAVVSRSEAAELPGGRGPYFAGWALGSSWLYMAMALDATKMTSFLFTFKGSTLRPFIASSLFLESWGLRVWGGLWHKALADKAPRTRTSPPASYTKVPKVVTPQNSRKWLPRKIKATNPRKQPRPANNLKVRGALEFLQGESPIHSK